MFDISTIASDTIKNSESESLISSSCLLQPSRLESKRYVNEIFQCSLACSGRAETLETDSDWCYFLCLHKISLDIINWAYGKEHLRSADNVCDMATRYADDIKANAGSDRLRTGLIYAYSSSLVVPSYDNIQSNRIIIVLMTAISYKSDLCLHLNKMSSSVEVALLISRLANETYSEDDKKTSGAELAIRWHRQLMQLT